MAPALAAKTERSSILTSASISIVAYAACDLIHEVLGHGSAIFLTPGVNAVSLTTVAISSSGTSPMIAAAGSLANLLAGVIGLLLLKSFRGTGTGRYFLWLLSTLNLLNATAYLVYSGILNYGDWQVVIAHLHPQIAWRAALVVIGLCSYVYAVYVCAVALRRLTEVGAVPTPDVPRVILVSYLAGGLLFVAGAAFNPIGLQLIWLSGIASGFAAMGGLLWMPGSVMNSRTVETVSGWKIDWMWLIAALLVAFVFVFIVGRGIRL